MAADTASETVLTGRLLQPETPRDNSMIRLSGAGECSRKLAYVLMGAPREADSVRTKMTFAIGHALHAMVQGWLVDLGWVKPENLEKTLIDPVRRIRGTMDGKTEPISDAGYPDPTGKRRIIEIKTITNLPWTAPDGKEYAGAFSRLEKPKDRHIDQATAYAMIENEQNPAEPVEALTFLYIAKDGGDNEMPVRAFTQKLSGKRWDRLQAKFSRIWRYIDKEELPPPDYNPFSAYTPCSYCPYRVLCVETGEVYGGTSSDEEMDKGHPGAVLGEG